MSTHGGAYPGVAIDLHLHTTASDGTWTPRELVEAAALRQVTIIAVTDHDTVAGIPEALTAGDEFGIQVIPGVEITTEVARKEYHLLGYFISVDDEVLRRRLTELKSGRHRRGQEMVRKLNALGIPLRFEDVLREAGDGAVGRPHVARALYTRRFVSRPQEAFDRWLGRDRPAYVPRLKLTPVEAVKLLLDRDAIPVLAHPGLAGNDAYIYTLQAAGLRGLEVVHVEHTASMVERYTRLADELGLLKTGGSDSHGPRGTHPVDVGGVPVPDEYATELLEANAARV